MRAFLGQVGGGEIDGDALEGQRQPDGGEGGAHALFTLGHRLVGQADNIELAAAGVRNMDLNIDFAGVDALEGHCIYVRDGHGAPERGAYLRENRLGKPDLKPGNLI